jgi:hypothetical protein
MAEGATVEESAMLVNRVTGRPREVDVVVRTTVASHEIVVGVEVTRAGRKATVEWVERMIGKHQNLPTDKLVLVAESGFRPQARDVARAAGVATFAPEDLDADDPAFQVLDQLRSLWPRFVSFLPEDAWIWLRQPVVGARAARADPDLSVFLGDGQAVGPLHEAIGAYLDANMARFAEDIELFTVTEDTDRAFVLETGFGWTIDVDGSPQQLHVCRRDTHELHPIERLRLAGRMVIHLSDVRLSPYRLGEIAYAYGEGKLGGEDVLMVATEGDRPALTVRFRSDPALNLEFEAL